jgi:hypothetical protein
LGISVVVVLKVPLPRQLTFAAKLRVGAGSQAGSAAFCSVLVQDPLSHAVHDRLLSTADAV